VILNSRRGPSEAGRRRKDFIIGPCFAIDQVRIRAMLRQRVAPE
jgi:hypothetical protein